MTAAEVGRHRGHVLAQELFKAELRSLGAIRGFVEKWAAVMGLDEDRTFRIKLCVSEACANAIEHPKDDGDITVRTWSRPGRFSVDVLHAGEFAVKDSRSRRQRGMGLPLMVALADEVKFTSMPEGGTRVSLSVFLK